MSAGRGLLWGVGLLVVAVGVGVCVRLYQVHEQGWEWRLTPSAVPPLVTYHDRFYDRGGHQPGVPVGNVPRGQTPGGGEIFAPDGGTTPTLIYVRDGDDVWVYRLKGGP